MKWSAYNEEMELEKDKDQIARYKAGIQEFDPFLGPYPLLPPESTYPAWVKLSNHISKQTINRIFQCEGFVDSHDDQLHEELERATKIIDRQQKEEKTKAEAEDFHRQAQQTQATETIQEEEEEEEKEEKGKIDTDAEMKMNIDPESPAEVTKEKAHISQSKFTMSNTDKRNPFVRFTPIDLRSSFRKGAVGEEVTRYSLDKSWLFNHLFTTVYNLDTSAYLGEYQVAFVTMLLSYHLGAFRQWKSMTILVCQSIEAISSSNYTHFFSEFIQTLHHQLTSIPSSFFMDLLFASPDQDDMTANFLEQALKSMGRNIQSVLRRGQCLELRKPMRALQVAVQESFEWRIPGDFKKIQKVVEIENDDDDEDEDYKEEGEYAPVIVE
ncbi:a1-alpha2 repression [Lobosporangium transversale]|nr:a1-alpha2 repression [Lobosporangium transversale]